MIYGKLFKKLYTGSMVGKGFAVFSLMPYVISHMEPDKEGEEFVVLNPEILATTFGATEKEVQKAIEFLCAPDPKTDTEGNEGRRLMPRSRYLFWVVNGKFYRRIQDEEDRREKAAARQQKHRDKKLARGTNKNAGLPLIGEETHVRNGTPDPVVEAAMAREAQTPAMVWDEVTAPPGAPSAAPKKKEDDDW